MTKRPAGEDVHAPTKAQKTKPSIAPLDGKTRIDRLVELLDNCTAAKETADALGEKFLAYLLAMTIQDARASMRHSVAAQAALKPRN